jgi:hypothetical protein
VRRSNLDTGALSFRVIGKPNQDGSELFVGLARPINSRQELNLSLKKEKLDFLFS